jgi:hypothetical protein
LGFVTGAGVAPPGSASGHQLENKKAVAMERNGFFEIRI